MKKDTFVDTFVEHLINKDEDVKKYFDRATEQEKAEMQRHLKENLANSYDSYAKEYFDNKGYLTSTATLLRGAGFAADTLGTYTFWTMGPVPGLGFKAAGFAVKTLADIIDGYHYVKYGKSDPELGSQTVDGLLIVGEGILERAAGYMPVPGSGVADLVRGTKKYDSKILGRAAQRAKLDFIKKFGKYEKPEPYIVPLKDFDHPNYGSLDEAVLQPA
ncbi:hypothetical protein KY328_02395 [Candidatus Woesearchaeota archaeon]|nr:hypothetical protein [Candidatus Woesearchaeota archaeon]MBW3021741.1 hypothetical protein [Candidatus Woesearchaeota archaeon]